MDPGEVECREIIIIYAARVHMSELIPNPGFFSCTVEMLPGLLEFQALLAVK
jgi:hypothetical protein